MAKATIEGSLTPCSGWPAPGKTETVELTPEVHKAARSGCIKIVAVHRPEEPAEAADTNTGGEAPNHGDGPNSQDNTLEPPPRSGSGSGREDWAEFLAQHPAGFVTEDKDRGELIAEWDAYLKKQTEQDSDG